MRRFDTAVIGGGFSGCAVAAQLARRAPAGFTLVIFEPGDLGRGAAYGTRHAEHLLNTRAQAMSVFSDVPDHFARWLGERAQPRDFVSRRLYGTYVGEVARYALERPGFALVDERVVRIGRDLDEFIVESSAGTRFRARAIVLASGNPNPNDAFLPEEVRQHPGYVADPWRFDYRPVEGDVLLVGSGLTALDALVALEASGHRGAVHVVSRRGRFPEVHADVDAYDVIPALDSADTRALLRSFRVHLAQARQRGFDWRAVVDALRPEADALWRRLPATEQRRFERHLRVLWERHRHRAPEQVDAVRARYQRAQRLFAYAGSVASMQGGIVTLALRNGQRAQLHPDWIVNCTGLAGAAAFAKDTLLCKLLAEGLIATNAGKQGLRTTWSLAAIGAAGPTERFWIVGPPVRGSRFEATAVPELRAMAELAAGEIVGALCQAEALAISSPELVAARGPSGG